MTSGQILSLPFFVIVGARGIDRIALFPAHVVLGFDLPDDWLELPRVI